MIEDFQPFLFGPCHATKEHQLVVKLSSTLPAGETLHTQQISHNGSITNMYYVSVYKYRCIHIYIYIYYKYIAEIYNIVGVLNMKCTQ